VPRESDRQALHPRVERVGRSDSGHEQGDRIDGGDRGPALAPRQERRRAARLGQEELRLLDFRGGDHAAVLHPDPIFLGCQPRGGREPPHRRRRIIGGGLLGGKRHDRNQRHCADENHSQPISLDCE
jgi:hypothetical protein